MDSNRRIIEALVRQGVGKAQALIEQLGSRLPALLPGYRTKILDGNHLAASERRLAVLRNVGSAPLPGHALVILDPALMLAIDVFACEDGHYPRASTCFSRVLATVMSCDLWIADRQLLYPRLSLWAPCPWGDFLSFVSMATYPWQALTELQSSGTKRNGSRV